MLQLAARGRFCFSWRRDPPQWLLREGESGQDRAPLMQTPFLIGRAADCQLVLPETLEIPGGTSRWHAYVEEKDGAFFLGDGTLRAHPGTGKPKGSMTGTYLNGRRLDAPEPLKPGDIIRIGPFEFGVEEAPEERAVDIDKLFARIIQEKPRELAFEDAQVTRAYSELPGLFDRINAGWGPDECLQAVLLHAVDNIPGAEVAVILLEDAEGAPQVRLAWQRGRGRVFDVRVSPDLLKVVGPRGAFLLEGEQGSGLIVPLRSHRSRFGFLYMDDRSRGASFVEKDLYLAHALGSVATLHLVLERQSVLQRTEMNMRKYFGPQVVSLILDESRKGNSVDLAVRECEASVLFVDMVNFSAACRGRTPREISDLLSPYYRLMSECIQRNGGHVDKFIGDAVLGVFGAQPIERPGASAAAQAAQALQAGREMLSTWAWSAPEGWGAHIGLRIGINSGRVVAGNIGFSDRMEYSVIGETVNLASHMQRLAEPDTIILSEGTRELLPPDVPVQPRGEAEVKGFGRVRTFRVES